LKHKLKKNIFKKILKKGVKKTKITVKKKKSNDSWGVTSTFQEIRKKKNNSGCSPDWVW
jgi:hypothetical protein